MGHACLYRERRHLPRRPTINSGDRGPQGLRGVRAVDRGRVTTSPVGALCGRVLLRRGGVTVRTKKWVVLGPAVPRDRGDLPRGHDLRFSIELHSGGLDKNSTSGSDLVRFFFGHAVAVRVDESY